MPKPLPVILIVILSLLYSHSCLFGQRYFNNPVSQYYRNDFLWNPANAGNSGHTRLYGLLNRSWIGFDGAPKLITFSTDSHFGENSGYGFQFMSDKSGVLQRDLGAIEYSYKIKLNDDGDLLRLGAALSLYRERLDPEVISDDGVIDPTAKTFNERPWDFDADIGVAYQSKKFNLGLAGYNLRTYIWTISNNPSDLAIAQAMASYTFTLQSNDKMNIKPLVAYKMFLRQDNILTTGAQFEFEDYFHTSVYWQSTGNVMAGLGVMIGNYGELNFFYSSNNKYGYNQQYEIGVKAIIP